MWKASQTIMHPNRFSGCVFSGARWLIKQVLIEQSMWGVCNTGKHQSWCHFILQPSVYKITCLTVWLNVMWCSSGGKDNSRQNQGILVMFVVERSSGWHGPSGHLTGWFQRDYLLLTIESLKNPQKCVKVKSDNTFILSESTLNDPLLNYQLSTIS